MDTQDWKSEFPLINSDTKSLESDYSHSFIVCRDLGTVRAFNVEGNLPNETCKIDDIVDGSTS